jgi:hypothetical protein
MKKKFRNITVDGVQYGWSVKTHLYVKTLSIWLDKNVILTRDFPHENNDSETVKITPSVVRTVIERSIKQEKESV